MMLSYENRPAPTMAPPTPPEEALPQPAPKYHHIFLVTGPAGCGKSTVAQHISKVMKMPYIEGDEYHPPSNIGKMSQGIPLTDADRWDWLTSLREVATASLTSSSSQGVVLTCSALKRKYRDVIRVAPYYSHNILVHFIYLHADEKVLLRRVAERKNHYMGANMVASQFGILEQPGEEEKDVLRVDIGDKGIAEVESEALQRVKSVIAASEKL